MTKKTLKKRTLVGNIKQKPKKRKKRIKAKKGNILTNILLPTLIATATCIIVYNNPKLILPKQSEIKKISFLSDLDFPTKRKIKSKLLKNYDTQSISDLSQSIQNDFNFKNVGLSVNAKNEIYVSIKKHEPKLVVEYGKPRIYTKAKKLIDTNNYSQSGLTKLTGLTPKESITYKNDRSISLPIGDREIIDKANLLIKTAMGYNIKYKSINFDEFRGFSGMLSNNNYNVVIGFPPFEAKYKKLNRIIYELKTQGKFSAKIELDYQGKAFVKKL